MGTPFDKSFDFRPHIVAGLDNSINLRLIVNGVPSVMPWRIWYSLLAISEFRCNTTMKISQCEGYHGPLRGDDVCSSQSESSSSLALVVGSIMTRPRASSHRSYWRALYRKLNREIHCYQLQDHSSASRLHYCLLTYNLRATLRPGCKKAYRRECAIQ